MFSVHVENSFSDKALKICKVPQGSIVVQLLFLLYVNDMVQAANCDLKKQSSGGVLRNFIKFTGKRLCQSFFFNKVAGY